MKKFSDDVIANHLRGVSGFNERGEEIPDPVPAELPIGFGRPRSLQEDIQAMIGAAVQQELADKGVETWEEANDFDTGEEEQFFSPHEDDMDPEHTFAREAEMRSGQVKQPDFEENKRNLDGLYAEYNKRQPKRRRSTDAKQKEATDHEEGKEE